MPNSCIHNIIADEAMTAIKAVKCIIKYKLINGMVNYPVPRIISER